jgi:hypothetical protein
MFSIRDMSGQEYVNHYATKKAEALPTEVTHVGVPHPGVTGSGNGSTPPPDEVAVDDPAAAEEERPRSAAAALAGARRRSS